jgi:Flp pilus assembly protein TadD
MRRGGLELRADPRYEALAREADAAIRAGDDAAAERAARMLVRANPREHGAWHILAIAALRTGRAAAGVEAAERAHQLDRKNPDYSNTLGVAYGDLGRPDDAIAALKRALRTRPAFADAHYNLGKVYERHERLDEAREAYRRVLTIDPRYVSAKHNLARVLRRLGEVDEALDLARELYEAQPDQEDRMIALAHALTAAKGVRTGLEFLTQCLARAPDSGRLHSERAALLLPLGEWEEGWREYLWRPDALRPHGQFPALLPDDLAGRAVRLVPDQGLGDVLFFLRFVPAIRARSGTVLFDPPPKLAPVLAGHPDFAPGLSAHDEASVAATVLLGDLPYVLQSRDVPPPVRLAARDALVGEVRDRLATLGPPPYIGLTWRGGTDLRAASEFAARQFKLFKEIDLELLGVAARGMVGTLVSVQRLPVPGETERLAKLVGRPVHDLSRVNEDLERIVAAMAVLDEYVGVSNTNMHLRAGLGRTARVLVPHPAEFRWMAAGDASPWFPGFTVYRQRPDRSWEDAIVRLTADLEARR